MTPKYIYKSLVERDLHEHADRIARRHHVTIAEMLGRSRTRHIKDARHELCFTLVRVVGLSLTGVGDLLGLDHTTVRSAVLNHEAATSTERAA